MGHFAVLIGIWLPVILIISLWAVMQWYDKLPSVERINAFTNNLNTRGGAVAILFFLAVFFFRYAINIRITHGEDSELWGFLSATCFGAAFGALLTMLTGENDNKPK